MKNKGTAQPEVLLVSESGGDGATQLTPRLQVAPWYIPGPEGDHYVPPHFGL